MSSELDHLLAHKNLSKSEQIALDHFRKKPEGRGFFAAAEIAARHNELEEAVQLLVRGLERHPSYSVARVYLAQLLFRRQLIQDAWGALESSPIPLKGNLTAQLLRLKLAVLLGRQTDCEELSKDLGRQEFQDNDVRHLIEQMDLKPFTQVRREYADFCKIALNALPQLREPEAEAMSPAHAAESFLKAANQEEALAQAGFRERVARGFFASSIHSLFTKTVTTASPEDSGLDQLTRARLMRRQGLYQQAYEIYQRLVHEAPGNELLRRELNDVRDLRDAQNQIDRQTDPALVESMERVRGLDQRIRLLNDLLLRLDEIQHEA